LVSQRIKKSIHSLFQVRHKVEDIIEDGDVDDFEQVIQPGTGKGVDKKDDTWHTFTGAELFFSEITALVSLIRSIVATEHIGI
jgi:hypothetical protein